MICGGEEDEGRNRDLSGDEGESLCGSGRHDEVARVFGWELASGGRVVGVA